MSRIVILLVFFSTLTVGLNPVAYYRLDESSGTTAADSVGTNPGTLLNFDPSATISEVIDNFEDGTGWDSRSRDIDIQQASTTRAKQGSYSYLLRVNTAAHSQDWGYVRWSWGYERDWSNYNKVGFWVYADDVSFNTNFIILLLNQGETEVSVFPNKMADIQPGQWNYVEYQLTDGDNDNVIDSVYDMRFLIGNNDAADTGKIAHFYIDDIRLYGSAMWTKGRAGGALMFDGVNDYISVPDSPSLRLGKVQTVEAWIYPTGNDADWVRIVGKGNPTYRNYGLWRQADGDMLCQIYGSYSYSCWRNGGPGDSGNIPVGSWHHAACVYDGYNMRMYIDGVNVQNCAYTGTPHMSADPMTIGYAGFHARFKGIIDDVAIHHAALSSLEIESHYRKGWKGIGSLDDYAQVRIYNTATGGHLVESFDHVPCTVSCPGGTGWQAQQYQECRFTYNNCDIAGTYRAEATIYHSLSSCDGSAIDIGSQSFISRTNLYTCSPKDISNYYIYPPGVTAPSTGGYAHVIDAVECGVSCSSGTYVSDCPARTVPKESFCTSRDGYYTTNVRVSHLGHSCVNGQPLHHGVSWMNTQNLKTFSCAMDTSAQIHIYSQNVATLLGWTDMECPEHQFSEDPVNHVAPIPCTYDWDPARKVVIDGQTRQCDVEGDIRAQTRFSYSGKNWNGGNLYRTSDDLDVLLYNVNWDGHGGTYCTTSCFDDRTPGDLGIAWNIGGEVAPNTCCGDDNNEYYRMCETDEDGLEACGAVAPEEPTGTIRMTLSGSTEVYHVDCGNTEALLRLYKGRVSTGHQQDAYVDYHLATDGDADKDPATGASPTWRKVSGWLRSFACNSGETCYGSHGVDPGDEPETEGVMDADGVTVTFTPTLLGREDTHDPYPGAENIITLLLTDDCRLGVRYEFSFSGPVPSRHYGVDFTAVNPTYWADDSQDGIFRLDGDSFTTQLRPSSDTQQALYNLDAPGQAGGICNAESTSGMCLLVTMTNGYDPGNGGYFRLGIRKAWDTIYLSDYACFEGSGCPASYDSGWMVLDVIDNENLVTSPTLRSKVEERFSRNRFFPDEPPSIPSEVDIGCCNLRLDCVVGSVCLANGWLGDVDGDSDNERCFGGVWYDDFTPPDIVLNAPPNGGVIRSGTVIDLSITDPRLDGAWYYIGGAGIPLSAPFDIITWGWGEGSIVVDVRAIDILGNEATERYGFTIDDTPPVIIIDGVEEGAFYNTAVIPDVIVIEPHIDEIVLTLDGQPYTEWTPIGAEGEHTLEVWVIDLAGNEAYTEVSFTIDTTPPEILISGVSDGAYYNIDVVPVIGITDLYLADESVTLNSAPFTSGTIISAEDEYVLEAWAVDLAGNEASVSLSFTIDKTPPEIVLSGVSDGAYYNNVVVPVIGITDIYLDETSITLNGASFVSGTPVSDEGVYTLAASATDLAGNSGSVSLSFTIDTTPPEIVITGVSDGAYYNIDVVPVIGITDLYLADESVTLNSAPFTSGTIISAEDEYVLEACAVDLAGNEASVSLSFTIDKTPPEIVISYVEDDAYYNVDVAPVIDITDLYIAGQSITLNGEPFVSGSLVSAEDEYILEVWAIDLAGNEASADLSFVIDKTPPEIVITGVSDGVYYNADVTPIIDITDPYLADESITLNGDPFASGTTVSDEGTYTLAAWAVDLAGNEAMDGLWFGIDKTVPVTTISLDGTMGDNDWFISSVEVALTPTDELSGIATTYYRLDGGPYEEGTSFTVTPEGEHVVWYYSVDVAGNVEAEKEERFKMDLTPPQITIEIPAAGASYLLNEVVLSEWSVEDVISGVALATGTVPSGTAIDTALVGPKTFTVDAVDNAGLTATLTLTYNIEYVYEGPFPPLEEGGVYKLGRTIPVKFSLHDADGIYIGTAISRLYLRPEGGLEIEATSTSAATEGNLFRPVADDEQYIFNLATKPLSAGLWTMRIELDDGTSKYIDITLVDGPPGQGSDDADDSDNVNEGNNGKGKGK